MLMQYLGNDEYVISLKSGKSVNLTENEIAEIADFGENLMSELNLQKMQNLELSAKIAKLEELKAKVVEK